MNHVKYTKEYLKKNLASCGLPNAGTKDELLKRWSTHYDSIRFGKVGTILYVETTNDLLTKEHEMDEIYIGTRYNTFDSNRIIRFKPSGGNFDMYVDRNRLKRYVLSNKPIPSLVIKTIINIYQSKELDLKKKQTMVLPNVPHTGTPFPHQLCSNWVMSVCYDHQIHACKWMMKLEQDIMSNQYIDRRFKTPNSIYKRFEGFDSSLVFNVKEQHVVIGNPPLTEYHNMNTLGGILADGVGVGKTLTMLLLCIEHSSQNQVPSRLDPLKYSYYPSSNTTLVITPSYLTEQWSSEIFKHTYPALKHFILSNKKDHMQLTYHDILTSDVIIVSERFLRSKHYQNQCALQSFTTLQTGHGLGKGQNDTPIHTSMPILHFIEWRRMIVDEGDVVLPNIHPLLSMYQSLFRWYVSATPVVNSDMIRYLNWNVPDNNIKPYLDTFSMCRTKEQVCVDLPLCERKTFSIPMTLMEREIYSRKGHSKNQRRKLCSTILHYKEYTHHYKSIDHFREELLKENKKTVRSIKSNQLVNEKQIRCIQKMLGQADISEMSPEMVRESNNHLLSLQTSQVKLETELSNLCKKMGFQNTRLSSFIGEEDTLECSICYMEIDKQDMTVLSCCHAHCNQCISQINTCSVCRNPFTTSRVCTQSSYGSKLDKMLSYVSSIPKSEQVLIYSQWTKSLHIALECFTENDISCVLFSNDTSKMGKILKEFREKKTRVMLLSIHSHNAGLDLFQANHILFMDSLKGDPEEVRKKEEQACGRVHRIGQSNGVKIVRFIMEHTVEDMEPQP